MSTLILNAATHGTHSTYMGRHDLLEIIYVMYMMLNVRITVLSRKGVDGGRQGRRI